jgi:hypothetical protein
MNRSVLSKVLTIALMSGMLWFFAREQRSISIRPQRTAGANAPAPGRNASNGSDDSNGSSGSSISNESPGNNVSAGAPESVVWRMVEASRAGDPARYLACYTGEMEPRLRRDFQEMGAPRSRDYLLEAHRRLKGVAVRSPRMQSPLDAQISVEYVYEDRNEVQQIHVKRVAGSWKIDRVDGAERIKTLVPYGAPVEN